MYRTIIIIQLIRIIITIRTELKQGLFYAYVRMLYTTTQQTFKNNTNTQGVDINTKLTMHLTAWCEEAESNLQRRNTHTQSH